MGRICCRELKESVSSASIEDPVIVPASQRVPKRSGTGSTLPNRFISSGSGDNKLAARSKSSEQRRHGFAICRCREDQSGDAFYGLGISSWRQTARAVPSLTSRCLGIGAILPLAGFFQIG